MAGLDQVIINAQPYPCEKWDTVGEGQPLEIRWTRGMGGGMGAWRLRAGNEYLAAKNIDACNDVLRIRPAYAASLSIDFDSATPSYGFFVKATASSVYFLFLLNGTKIYKIALADNTLASTKTVASSVMGRPCEFAGNWYIPCGSGADALKLTTITGDGTADTYTTLTDRAQHYAGPIFDFDTASKVPKLARALSGAVYLSATGADSSWGSAFTIGSTGQAINDLVVWLGELAVSKPDSVWRMDGIGNSFQVQQFVGARTLVTKSSPEGAMCTSAGPYFYHTHASGFNRYYADGWDNIGPEVGEGWQNQALDSFTPFPAGSRWLSCDVYGKWIYASFGANVYFGQVTGDGHVIWHGCLATFSGDVHVFVTDGTANPILWLVNVGGDLLKRVNLAPDGSPRDAIGTTRGEASLVGQIWMPKVHMGEFMGRDLADKRKQGRRMWAFMEGGTITGVQMGAHFDGASTSTNIGASAAGGTGVLIEDDFSTLFYTAIPTLTVTLAGAGTDWRVSGWGIQAVTPMVYRIRIKLTPETLRGYNISIPVALDNLRDLKNGQAMSINVPGLEVAFSGYVVAIQEHMQPAASSGDQAAYVLDVDVERFDWQLT